ncbi:MAG: cache domain-containing protein, partial [Clostridium sp.]
MKKNKFDKNGLKKPKGKKLSFQLISLLIVASFLPILFISLGTYYSLSTNLKSEFDTIANQSTSRVNDAIDALYKSNYETTDMLSNDPNAVMINSNPDSAQWLMKSFDGFIKTHPDTLNIYLGTVDKKMYLAPKTDLPADFDPTSRGWYKDAITNDGKTIATNPYIDGANPELKKYVITFAKSVKDNEGNIVGVIGLDVDLEVISSMVAGIKLGS